MPDKEWADRVKGILKAELKRRNISYRQLAQRLEAMGIHETERNINNKISRGGFTAVFFVQCLVDPHSLEGRVSLAVRQP